MPDFSHCDVLIPSVASEISSQVYIIKKNFPEGEYLYIENKQPILWDSNWESGGLVIYKVDDNKVDQSERGYPGHPNWPQEHYRVQVLQADGLFDIEKGNGVGDVGDMFSSGMSLVPGGDYPNTDSFSTGQKQTGITINVLTDSSFIMLFEVSGLD